MLIGSELVIECRSEDGGDILFRVDQNGALLYNAKFDIIANSSEIDESGNPKRRNQISLNPYVGIAIGKEPLYEKDENNSYKYDTFNEDNAMFYVDIDTGDIAAKGNIHANTLYLSKTGGSDIIAYIDKRDNYSVNPSNGSKVDDDSAKYKILGNYIEGRGLKAYDKGNNLRVHINGADGSLKMYNGYIEMQNVATNSNGRVLKDSKGNDLYNKLYINPDEFIKWTIKNEDKFYYDKEKDALVFGGLLRTDSLSIIFDNNNENSTSWLTINSGGISGDRVVMTTANSRPIDMQCGSLMVNSNNVATQSWVKTYVADQIAKINPPSPTIPAA